MTILSKVAHTILFYIRLRNGGFIDFFFPISQKGQNFYNFSELPYGLFLEFHFPVLKKRASIFLPAPVL